MLIGKSSKLYKELYEAELITGEPYLDYEFSKTICTCFNNFLGSQMILKKF